MNIKKSLTSLAIAFAIVLFVLSLIGHYNLVVINISPSVPIGIYIRTKKKNAQYVAFSKKAIKKNSHKIPFSTLVKKYRFVNENEVYVYGTHPHSITSKHIGFIPVSHLRFLNLIIPFSQKRP